VLSNRWDSTPRLKLSLGLRVLSAVLVLDGCKCSRKDVGFLLVAKQTETVEDLLLHVFVGTHFVLQQSDS
jgi:hypothetical protein